MEYRFLPLEFKIQTKIDYTNGNQRYITVQIIYTVAERIKTAAMKKGLRFEKMKILAWCWHIVSNTTPHQ
jgi:hypothetical protein